MAVTIKAGELARPVQLLKPTLTPTASGERSRTYTVIASPWAKIEPLSGHELERARSFGGEVSHRIEIRHHDDVQRDYKVVYKNRSFFINGILNDLEDGVKQILYCTEVV
jgi:SPP1 family predicted phage head-tail adaptor